MQISPTQLENILLLHHCVEEVAVIGIPHLILGEVAAAFVVLKNEYKNSISNDELLHFVNGNYYYFTFCEMIHFVNFI